MNPWKAVALIVPAGLVIGMTAGAASRPVMVQKAEDYWPASVAEDRAAYEAPRPFYEGGPQDLTPAAYSYRPNLDFSAEAWPDQGEPAYLAPAVAEAGAAAAEPPPPEFHRPATIEAVADRAEAAADDAVAAAAAVPSAATEQPAAAAPAPVPAIETAAF